MPSAEAARAQVVLASGLGEEGVGDWRKKGGAHLHQLLKFLTVRTEADKKDGRVERSGITALGGPHDPALDGAIAHASKCAAGSRSLLLWFCWLQQYGAVLAMPQASCHVCSCKYNMALAQTAACMSMSSTAHSCCHIFCCVLCRSTQPLIAACKRHAKTLLSLDLTPCTRWLRFVDVHYQRPPASSAPDAMETTEVGTAPTCSRMGMGHGPGLSCTCFSKSLCTCLGRRF